MPVEPHPQIDWLINPDPCKCIITIGSFCCVNLEDNGGFEYWWCSISGYANSSHILWYLFIYLKFYRSRLIVFVSRVVEGGVL